MAPGLLFQALATTGLVLFYYSTSISITFYNKWILSSYAFPFSITIIHLVIKFFIAWVVRKGFSLYTKETPLVLGWRDYLKNIAPIAVLSAIDIGLSNWSLVFITISLYTMSKSTSIIFILLFAIIFKLEKPRLSQIGVIALVFIGLFLFTFHSSTFQVEGFVLVIGASVLAGLRWSVAQLVLQKEELGLHNPVNTVFHLQPAMILTLLPLAIFIDGIHLGTSALIFRASVSEFAWTALYISVAGVLAFLLGVSEYLLVYHTSGLTLSVSGVLKEVVILTLSTLWWEEQSLSVVNMVGMAVCVAGVSLHVLLKALRAKQDENEQKLDRTRGDTIELVPSRSHSNSHKTRGKRVQFEDQDSDDSIVVYETKMD